VTVAVDPRVGPPVFERAVSSPKSASAARGRWRFAARLARREVRRRPGRTFLVMLLVAVPVFGMTGITVLVRTDTDTPAEVWAREFGQADLASAAAVASANASPSSTTSSRALPAGSRTVTGRLASNIGLELPNGTARLADVTDLPLTNAITRGMVLLRSGRFPTAPGEALISPNLAQAFHVGVGDTLHLSSPSWTERVVGIGVRATKWNNGFVALRGNELATAGPAVANNTVSGTLVKLPGHPSDAQLASYAPAYRSRLSLSLVDHSQRNVDWILVGGLVALAIVGIVISGAFAVSARRQLVTLGQLSANGADETLLRRSLSMQGLWCGLLGTVLGIAAAACTLAAMRGHIEGWIHVDPGPYVWAARDLVAIFVTGVAAATLAAFVPARSAARVPVLSALAGRRPLGSLPRRIVPIGAGLFGAGVFVLVLVATASRNSPGGNSNGLALSAVFGGLLVLAGACCVSSIVVASLAHLGRFLRGPARIAVRSIVRSRARSAAVVMALAAVNAGAIAIGTALDSHTKQTGRFVDFMPNNALLVNTSTTNDGGVTQEPAPVDASVSKMLHTLLPHAQWTTRRLAVVPGESFDGTADLVGPPDAFKGGPGGPGGPDGPTTQRAAPGFGVTAATVADPGVLRFAHLSQRDVSTLQRTGALLLDSPVQRDGQPLASTTAVTVGTDPHTVTVRATVARDSSAGIGGVGFLLVTEAKAHALGLQIEPAGALVENDKAFTSSQQASLQVVDQTVSSQTGSAGTITSVVWSGDGSGKLTPQEFDTIVIAIVVIIALIVLAMSLGLSAAETRDERDVLVSLGARPGAMRSLAAWKAALLAAAGALIAVPTGFVPIAVVFEATVRAGERADLTFPWSSAVILCVVAPLVAAAVAYVGSGVAQTIRPTRMSTFAED
jgi:putative ABC transport system permease protein